MLRYQRTHCFWTLFYFFKLSEVIFQLSNRVSSQKVRCLYLRGIAFKLKIIDVRKLGIISLDIVPETVF